MSLYYCVH